MNCVICGKKREWLIELLQDVKGEGPSKKHVCFWCIGVLGEQFMRDELREREKQ